MAWLIRDLGDGSIVGLLLAASVKPRAPKGFEATYVVVVSDDGGNILFVSEDTSKVGIGGAGSYRLVAGLGPSHSSIDFLEQPDAEVWRKLTPFLDWKDELDEED